MPTSREIAKMIDHALLKPEMDLEAVRRGCELAAKYHTATVCVRPCDLPVAAEVLSGSDVKLCAVVGFPHGSNTMEIKVFETVQAIEVGGAREIDMVLNIGRLVSGDFDYVENEIRAIAEAAHARGVILKVIFENAYLTDDRKAEACRISERAGADFVKTSTGFAATGATMRDLKLMRASCSLKVQLKAAGGVRTLDDILKCRAAGCTRVGASATEAIMEEAYKREAEGKLLDIVLADGMELGKGY